MHHIIILLAITVVRAQLWWEDPSKRLGLAQTGNTRKRMLRPLALLIYSYLATCMCIFYLSRLIYSVHYLWCKLILCYMYERRGFCTLVLHSYLELHAD